MIMKKCNKCENTKPIIEFNRNKICKDGYRSMCKNCMKDYRTKNASKIALQKKNWENNNKDKIRENKRKYYQANKEYLDAYKSNWNTKNIEKVRAYGRKSRKNPEVIISRKIWEKENRISINIIKKQYKHKRRLRERKGSVTTEALREWLNNTTKICTYCNKLCRDDYHIDHIQPLSKDGEHEIDNLTISCPSCNLHKSNKTLLHWMTTKLLEVEDKKPQR